jgi:hypothetical protein
MDFLNGYQMGVAIARISPAPHLKIFANSEPCAPADHALQSERTSQQKFFVFTANAPYQPRIEYCEQKGIDGFDEIFCRNQGPDQRQTDRLRNRLGRVATQIGRFCSHIINRVLCQSLRFMCGERDARRSHFLLSDWSGRSSSGWGWTA